MCLGQRFAKRLAVQKYLNRVPLKKLPWKTLPLESLGAFGSYSVAHLGQKGLLECIRELGRAGKGAGKYPLPWDELKLRLFVLL